MNILCISASNTMGMGKNSTSTKVCELIGRIVENHIASATTRIIPLMEKKISFCMLCGDCAEHGLCPYDREFNSILDAMKTADICFFVVPHYTPIPSKLIAMFEKLNEILYTSAIRIPQFQSPFSNKKAVIIGHGGMQEDDEVLERYYRNIVTPVANTLMSFGFSIVGLDEKYQLGVPFGLSDECCIQIREGAVFPDIRQDWHLIENRVRPIILKAIDE